MYKTGEPVGKTLAQVSRDTKNMFTVSDTEIYGKWSQALSSADDLVAMCPDDGKLKECDYCFSSVIPVLVVPDGTLWRCAFDLDGNRTGAIAPVPRISTKSGPFSPGEWLESLPGSARGY